MRIVKIRWTDPQFVNLGGLATIEDIQDLKPVNCEIVGHLVLEKPDCYIVAKELWENGSFKYVHVIPKKIVRDFTTLKENSK